jgi:hypothetical protein
MLDVVNSSNQPQRASARIISHKLLSLIGRSVHWRRTEVNRLLPESNSASQLSGSNSTAGSVEDS